MDEHIIDCCSLLNLYTGWGGLRELHDLRRTWYVCEAVRTEAEYTREYDSNGVPISVPLDTGDLVKSGLLLSARIETEQELEDYVNFASELDDGEAQALALAKHRRLLLLTDDRRANNVAQRADVGVRTISTANVLQIWSQLDPLNEARLHQIIPRISTLARFTPRADLLDYDWWQKYLER